MKCSLSRSLPARFLPAAVHRHFYWLMLVLIWTLARTPCVHADDEARLLRFPTIHGDTIVFSYAGDLYSVPATGGVARQLTSDVGYEMFAHFSPDGQTLAFTGQYDGNTEVYVMPALGGVPRRLTFTATASTDAVSEGTGPNNIVMGWKNNQEIVFRGRGRDLDGMRGQLFVVNSAGGLPVQIPVPYGGFCSFSPNGKRLAYNRIFDEFRNWHGYRGGMVDNIWIHDFETNKTVNLTQSQASNAFPMWAGDKIYFLSDQDGAMRFNLYVFDTMNQTTRPLTAFKDFDVKFPSLGDRAIVFENAGYIYKFDLASEKAVKVPVQIHQDFPASRSRLTKTSEVGGTLWQEIAPDGSRALFSDRGRLFTVSATNSATRLLTPASGINHQWPKWSPDGKHIACVSDASGEKEIHLIAPDGIGPDVQLTNTGAPDKMELFWAPDSQSIAWRDRKGRLCYVNVASKAVKLAAESQRGLISQYCWAPDSKWIAYVRSEAQGFDKLWLYSLDQDQSFTVTNGRYKVSNPAFSRDGKYLFFVSERIFRPVYSNVGSEVAYTETGAIYLVTLAKDTPAPFAPKCDEVAQSEASPTKQQDGQAKAKEKKTASDESRDKGRKQGADLNIDCDGLQDRVVRLPTKPGTYIHLASAGGSLYYQRLTEKDGLNLYRFDMAQKKESDLGEFSGYELSDDGKKMLILNGDQGGIIDLPSAKIVLSAHLNLSGMQAEIDLHKDWSEMFYDCWRKLRDGFYDPHMHGVDWKAIRAKYEPLLPHVNHRADLTYVVGEMIAELNCSHAMLNGGRMPAVARLNTGLLGAQLEVDEKTKFYRISKILKGKSWRDGLRSPLSGPGIRAREGDYLLAVNGRPTNRMSNIYAALVNTVGKQVCLKLNQEPTEKGSWELTVTPIASERDIYYADWLEHNIQAVAAASGGRIGYVHVPDMVGSGLSAFMEYYYPQLHKETLIIDIRDNRGGSSSHLIIERLKRQSALVQRARNSLPTLSPEDVASGPKVCLLNEFSASAAEQFAYAFRYQKLGKLIGKRSCGALVGFNGLTALMDGGGLSVPEVGYYAADGKTWAVEGHGVDPDIVVDNDPAREYAGIDDQLNKAVEVLLEELKSGHGKLPPAPPYPVKSK